MRTKNGQRIWAALLALVFLLSTGTPALAAGGDGSHYAEGYLDTDKSATAVDVDQGIYQIGLMLSGEPTYTKETLRYGADVVIVMDLSGSMDLDGGTAGETRWETAITAANSLIDLLLVESDADVRVGAVGFGSVLNGVAAHATLTDDGFTRDPQTAKESFGASAADTRAQAGILLSGTNSHAGLIAAEELIVEDRTANPENEERELYVIFITDGEANECYTSYTDRNNFTVTTLPYVDFYAPAIDQAEILKTTYGATIYSVYCFSENPGSTVRNFMTSVASGGDKFLLGTADNMEAVFLEIGAALLEEFDVTIEHEDVRVVDQMSAYVDFLENYPLELQRRPVTSTDDDDWVTCTAGEAGSVTFSGGVLTWTMAEFDCDYAYRVVYTVQIKHEYAGQTPHDDQISGRDTAEGDGVGVLANGYTCVESSIVDEQEILVPSIYREGEVTVTFYLNYGINAVHDRQILIRGHLADEPSAPYRLGYTFGGWYLDTACQDEFAFDTPVTEDLDLYAKWTPQYYTVIYYANNGTDQAHPVATDIVGQAHQILGNDVTGFVHTGHAFVGWSKDAPSDVPFTGSTVTGMAEGEVIEFYAIWSAEYYDIVYHAQNGTDDTDVHREMVDYPHTVLEGLFTYTGHKFLGWSLDEDSTELYTDATVISSTEGDVIDLYAVWAPMHYDVVYHAQNGTDDTDVHREMVDYPHTVLSNPFTYTGHKFLGWSLEKDSTELYTDATVISSTEGDVIDLYAVWAPMHYDVVYHAQNGTDDADVHREMVDYPHTVLEGLFTYTGHKFLGWSLEKDSTELYTDATVISSTEGEVIDLYAVWAPMHYDVVYHAQNGTGDTDVHQEMVDYPHTVLSNPFTYTGHKFLGWSLDENSTALYTESTVLGETEGQTIDLYAVWQPIYYDIVYHAQNGTGATVSHQELVDYPHTVLEGLFTYTGYAFMGWSLDENATELYTADTVLGEVEGEEIHLYAVWSAQHYQVIYHAQNGTGATVSRQELVDHVHTVLSNGVTGFSRTGYAFVGWSYSADADTVNLSPGGTVTGTQAGQIINLYAVWAPQYYSVVYHANNGTPATYEASELVDHPHGILDSGTVRFSHDDHTFLGWSYDAYALTPDLYPGETVTGTQAGQTINLYAVWEEIIYPAAADYTVIYDPNGGYGTRYTTTEAAGSLHTVLNNLLEELSFYSINHVFWAWSTDPDATVDDECILPGTWISGEEGETIVLYAVWNPLPFRLTPHYSYIVGFEDGEIKPMENLTRAQAATILFRLLDDDIREEYYTADNTFPDVGKGDWFNKAVSTIVNMGAIEGYEDGTFKPNQHITRAELSTIIAKLSGVEYTGTGHYFSDIAGWYQNYINLAASLGWVTGYEDGTFKPNQNITRAETVTMINNVLDRNPQSEEDMLPGMKTWPDNADPTQWYYLGIQEATNSHTFLRDDYGVEVWAELVDNPDWAALEKPD